MKQKSLQAAVISVNVILWSWVFDAYLKVDNKIAKFFSENPPLIVKFSRPFAYAILATYAPESSVTRRVSALWG